MERLVVHLIITLGRGGCESFLVKTLPLLSHGKHIVVTIGAPGELAKNLEEKGIEVIALGARRPISLQAIYRLQKLIRAIKPNLLISYLFHADILARLSQFWFRFPVVPFLRAVPTFGHYWPIRIFERLTKRFVRHYLANSQAIKDYYVNILGAKAEKFTVIPNAIDLKKFNNEPSDKSENLKKVLGISDSDIVLLCTANFHPNKGHRFLLEAFETVYQDHNNLLLLLVGDGQERFRLETQIANYQSRSSIVFLGKRDDVEHCLKVADVFVFPTLQEGMSNALLEAMASSCAIITTDIPENRYVTNSAVFVPPADVPALTSAIAFLVEDQQEREDLMRQARDEAEEKYDLRKTVPRLEQALHDLTT